MFTCEPSKGPQWGPHDGSKRPAWESLQYVCLVCNYTGPRGPIAWYANEDEYSPGLAFEAALWVLDGLVVWDGERRKWLWGRAPALSVYRVCQLRDCPRCGAKVASVDILP